MLQDLASKMGEPSSKKTYVRLVMNMAIPLVFLKLNLLLHGLSQVRDRTFYFFWKVKQVPLFDILRPTNDDC